jgi:hypothetical protein
MAAAPQGYTVIGQGAYGRVFSPAFPNLINDQQVEFPDQVTKLFFNKESRNAALEHSKYIQEIVGKNDHLRLSPYAYPYTAGNVPPSLLRGLEPLGYQNATKPLYLARAPYLGVSVVDALYFKNMVPQMRTMPIHRFISEVAQLFHKTESLYYAGKIHGDVRMANVMYHPESHFFTLIDYDFLKDMDDFYHTYPQFGFYSNPPECLFMADMHTVPVLHAITPEDQYLFERYIVKNYAEYRAYWQSQNIHNVHVLLDAVDQSVMSNAMYLSQFLDSQLNKRDEHAVSTMLYEHVFPYFDNYSLSLILLTAMEHMYPGIHSGEEFTKEIKDSLKRVLDPAIHDIHSEEDWDRAVQSLMALSALLRRTASFTIVNRLTPDKVSEQLKGILQIISKQGGGRKRSGRRRKTRHPLRNKPNAKTHKKPAAKTVAG